MRFGIGNLIAIKAIVGFSCASGPTGIVAQHLLKYFGSSCSAADVESLSKSDQDGIRKGVASPGMTRQGVIYAMGYPPPHVTPDLDAKEWTYWKNRFDRMIVVFDDKGRAAEVRS